jgi:hypothetical protein
MLWSNDTYLEVLPSYAGARLDPNITIQTEHPSGVFTGSALRIRVESSVNSPGIERTVQVFNWNTSSWDLLNLGIAPQIDEAQELLISQGVPNYLGSQGVRVRMNWRSTAAAGSRSWKAKMDNIRVVIDPPTP